MTSTRSQSLPATPLYPGAITLDTLGDLFAHHRDRFGGWKMEEPTQEETAAAAAKAEADAKSAADAAAAAGGAGGGEEKRFDQAAVDKMIGERLAAEKKKFDEQLAEIQANAGKSEKERAEAERDKFKQQAEGATKTAAEKVAKTEAKLAALVGGARDDRLEAVLKQADLSEAVADDGTVDDAKVKAAVDKVLADYPEWKRTPGSSGKEHGAGGGGGKPTFTKQQIKDMSPEERAKRVDELNEAMAEGRITG